MPKKKAEPKVTKDFDPVDDLNKVETARVDEKKAQGKDAIVDKLKEYGFAANLGHDAAWLAAKLNALEEGRLKEHEMTPEGYKQMLKDFG